MSESKDESKDESTDSSGVGISDDQLPEDLVPSEDNPLAEGLPDGETVGDLLNEGKHAENTKGDQADDDADTDADADADTDTDADTEEDS